MTFIVKEFIYGETIIEAEDMNNIQKGVKDALDGLGEKSSTDHDHEGTYVKVSEVGTLVGPPGADGVDGNDGAPGTPGTNGREIEIQKSSTHIQYRYVGDSNWIDIVALADITGLNGQDGVDGLDGTFNKDTEFPELKTTAKKIIESINEIFDLVSAAPQA